MSLVFIEGDMFSSKADILCHQVNCMGRMGSGIAKTVRKKFPTVYNEYMNLCHSDGVTPDNLLGYVQFVKCGTQIIANLFAQRNYGYDGELYTSYAAFQNCLRQIREKYPPGTSIAFPYGIGCGLGGGQWSIIARIVEAELSADYEVEIWDYRRELLKV